MGLPCEEAHFCRLTFAGSVPVDACASWCMLRVDVALESGTTLYFSDCVLALADVAMQHYEHGIHYCFCLFFIVAVPFVTHLVGSVANLGIHGSKAKQLNSTCCGFSWKPHVLVIPDSR
jgi:hypothetical protein